VDLVAEFNQVRQQIWSAVMAWAFLPVLCALVQYGEVTLTIHDRKLKDLHLSLGIRGTSPPNP
jgi:hypothetical protein